MGSEEGLDCGGSQERDLLTYFGDPRVSLGI